MNSFKFILILFVSFFGVTQTNASTPPEPAFNFFKKASAPKDIYYISGSVFGFVTPREPARLIVVVNGATIVNNTYGSRGAGLFNLPINVPPGTTATITVVDFRVYVNGNQIGSPNGTFNYTF
jgi:hypothetical protein